MLCFLYVVIYEGYPESKFRLRILPLQRCGHDGARVFRVLLILCQGTDAICRHLKSVYASCCVFIIFKEIENPAACEMRSIIRFLNAKNTIFNLFIH